VNIVTLMGIIFLMIAVVHSGPIGLTVLLILGATWYLGAIILPPKLGPDEPELRNRR